jgi:hypothetical protein
MKCFPFLSLKFKTLFRSLLVIISHEIYKIGTFRVCCKRNRNLLSGVYIVFYILKMLLKVSHQTRNLSNAIGKERCDRQTDILKEPLET